jgi:predicted dehydrogenase
MTVTVGVLGAGRISHYHAEGFSRAGARIVGVADPRREAADSLAQRFGALAVADEEALFALEPDVVVIATPHDLHGPQATKALNAGIDVFLDKPLALSAAEGAALADLAAGLGRNLGVNHNMLFHPAIVEARTHLSGLGRLVSASAWSEGWLDIAPWDFRLDRVRTGGGAWFDAGPHLLYTLDALAGPFTDLSGLAATGPSRLGGEDSFAACGRFANGAIASLRVSYAHTAPGSRLAWPDGWQQGFELHGTDGALRVLVTPVGQVETMQADDRDWTIRATGLPFAASFWGAIADFLATRTHDGQQQTARKSVQILTWIEEALAPRHSSPNEPQ